MSETKTNILNHIVRVNNKINTIVEKLINRGKTHDQSKLVPVESILWENMDKEQRYPYGTPEYLDKMNRNKAVFEMHYANNRHHPEHFKDGIKGMDLVDIIEMLSDWISYSDEITASEAIEMIEKQVARFSISEDLKQILINTVINNFAVIRK